MYTRILLQVDLGRENSDRCGYSRGEAMPVAHAYGCLALAIEYSSKIPSTVNDAHNLYVVRAGAIEDEVFPECEASQSHSEFFTGATGKRHGGKRIGHGCDETVDETVGVEHAIACDVEPDVVEISESFCRQTYGRHTARERAKRSRPRRFTSSTRSSLSSLPPSPSRDERPLSISALSSIHRDQYSARRFPSFSGLVAGCASRCLASISSSNCS